MRIRNRITYLLLAALVIIGLSACEKNEQEANKFPRADDSGFSRKFGEMTSYTLDNGIAVYMQQEFTNTQVAVEVFYRAGFVHEPAGQVQVSHLTEHVVVFSRSASYEAREATKKLSHGGMVGAEAVGDFVHFDYVVQKEFFEEVMKVEAERLISVQFEDEVREEQAEKAAKEIRNVMQSKRGPLTKFAMMTLLQVIHHGQVNVPINEANFQRTIPEIEAFHKQYYRTDGMIIVIVGDIEVEPTRALVEKYFGDIPRSPEPPTYSTEVRKTMSAHWDIDASVVYLVYPGPFDDPRERAALVMFGSYLHQLLAFDQNLPSMTATTYTTNPTYPVANLPFFVFGQPAPYRSVAEVRDALIAVTDRAVSTLDEKMFERLKTSIRGFVTTSFLAAQADNVRIEHHVVIGQHAVNTGIKHYLKGGSSDEEFLSLIDSVTFQDMQQILARHLSPDKRTIVTITGP